MVLGRRKDATASTATLDEGTIEEELQPVLVGVEASGATSAETASPAASAEAALPASFSSAAFAPDTPAAPEPVATPNTTSSTPAAEGRRARRGLLGRRGNEAEPASAPTQKPKYPRGQPATPGGHLLGALLVAQTIITAEQLDRALESTAA
jgi:hypothetical protein